MQYFVVPLYHGVLCTFKIHNKLSVPGTNRLTNLKRGSAVEFAYTPPTQLEKNLISLYLYT